MTSWSDLKFFLSLVEHGSLSAAARIEGVSQPTLSRRLTTLEESLKTDLFNRSVDGLQLTPTGERLVEHAERMKEEATAFERSAAGRDVSLSGLVNISSVEILGTEWLPEVLREFTNVYDGVRIDIQIDTAPADLLRREADIAIRMYRPQEPDLVAKKIGSIAYGLFATQEYIDRRGMPKGLDDICEHDLVLPGPKILEIIRKKLGSKKIHIPPPVFTSNDSHALASATLAGYGIGVHSALTANRHPELISVLPYAITQSELWLVTHADINKSAKIRAVYEHLSEMFLKNQDLFSIE